MDQSVRTIGMLCHLMALSSIIGVPFGNILGPLIVWLIYRDRDAFIDEQGKESLNFQISMTIYFTVASIVFGIIALLTCGIGFLLFPLLLVAAIVELLVVIMAAIEANSGRTYHYPYSIRFIV